MNAILSSCLHSYIRTWNLDGYGRFTQYVFSYTAVVAFDTDLSTFTFNTYVTQGLWKTKYYRTNYMCSINK